MSPTAARPPVFASQVVTRDDVSLHVTTGGPEGAPVIVFVHGYPDTSRVWLPVMRRLADRYRVVAYDVRGFGGSTAPATRRRGWSLDALTADFLAVAAAVSPDAPVHLVGHDWGSVQSWAFAVDEVAAARLASFTSISGPSLDLVQPWVRGALRSPRRLRAVLRQAIASGYIGFFQLPVVPELFWRVAGGLVSRGLYATSGVADPAAHVAPTFATDARNGLELYRQNILRRTSAPRALAPGALTVPLQLVVPARDRFLTPALYEDLPALAPGLVRRDIAAGHWVPLSHPGPLARWIDEHVASVGTGAPASRSLRRATHRPDRRRFDDTLVLITGAARGIGRETAFAFAALGAELVLADLDKVGLDRTAELCVLAGAPDAHVVELDVADREAVERLAADLEATIGVPDIVVNNAGVGAAGPLLATSDEEIDRVLRINLGGVVNGCTSFGRRLQARGEGGHLVNLASAAAFLPSRATPLYGTSKAAVLALSENLRAELADDGIAVTAICPGVVDTRIIDDTSFAGAGGTDADRTREAMVALYRRRAYPPAKVAAAIVRAVERGPAASPALVPVTPEARLGHLASRLTPNLLRRAARVDPTQTIARLRRPPVDERAAGPTAAPSTSTDGED